MWCFKRIRIVWPARVLILCSITAALWLIFRTEWKRILPKKSTRFTEQEICDNVHSLHAELMQLGREYVMSDQEIQLTRKYWDLAAWLRNLTPETRVQNAVRTLPEPYDIGKRSLWDQSDGWSPAGERVVAQVLWCMQLIVGNYLRSQQDSSAAGNTSISISLATVLKQYPAHTIASRRKRIFVGYLHMWLNWIIFPEWAQTGRIRAGSQFLAKELQLHDLEPSCDIIAGNTSRGLNWTGIDLIASLGQWYTFPKGISAPGNIPWFQHTHEPPTKVPLVTAGRLQHINTYWLPSLVPHMYAKWLYFDPERRAKDQSKDYSAGRGRDKMVVMLISNCWVGNGRLEYARQLGKYIPVDVVGECGDPRCKITKNPEQGCVQLLKQYRFYLAFENTNCQDYITEKLTSNAFYSELIPIVMGAPPAFYRAYAPQNSYIHVQDFESPAALAVYLHVLAGNSTMYNDYFRWKGTGEMELLEGNYWMASACAMLYYDKPMPMQKRRRHWVPNRMDENGGPLCLRKGEWYW